jgi:hypothetical protein
VTGILYRSTGRKIDNPELLEAIRLTIINNMIQYHPVTATYSSYIFSFFSFLNENFADQFIWYQESSSQLAMGSTFGPEAPTEQVLD